MSLAAILATFPQSRSQFGPLFLREHFADVSTEVLHCSANLSFLVVRQIINGRCCRSKILQFLIGVSKLRLLFVGQNVVNIAPQILKNCLNLRPLFVCQVQFLKQWKVLSTGRGNGKWSGNNGGGSGKANQSYTRNAPALPEKFTIPWGTR
jgi:hypothetical protein